MDIVFIRIQLIVVSLIILYVILSYNRCVSLRNYTREAFSTMDIYLKKRWDLIPNLIATVKGYEEHEKELFTKLTEIRAKNYSKMSDFEKLKTNIQISNAIPKIFAIAENYPDIKANQNFAKLMEDLNAIENDIANSRRYYNATVREFNTYLEIFPSNLVGILFNINKAKLFEIDESERENIKVQF